MQVDYVSGSKIKDLSQFILNYDPDKIFIDRKLEWQRLGMNSLANVANGNMKLSEITTFIACNIQDLWDLMS